MTLQAKTSFGDMKVGKYFFINIIIVHNHISVLHVACLW